jgi:energy-coupling factor transport system ATP-binding protein
MALLEVAQFSFSYPEEQQFALKGIDLTARQGEFVLVCGPSGSGKTTLLRHFKHELAPVGTREGEIRFAGRPVGQLPPREAASRIGMVQQDPEYQTVTDRVLSEIVFGMENLGFSSDLMRRRAAELTHFFGLDGLLHRPMFELSGGQKQTVHLASVLALQPELLLLDEPTAQLDPVAAKELLQLLHRLNRELGLTVILSEHRLDDAFHLADRVIVMEEGMVRFEGRPTDVARALWDSGDGRWRAFVPPVPLLFLTMQGSMQPAGLPESSESPESSVTEAGAEIPLTLKDVVQQLLRTPAPPVESVAAAPLFPESGQLPPPSTPSAVLLECKELGFQYDPKASVPVIRHASLSVREGDILAILGSNGSGKSTLLKLMAGVLVPQFGSIFLQGVKFHRRKKASRDRALPIGYLDQNPFNYFSEETVEQELVQAATRAGTSNPQAKAASIAEHFDLLALLSRHPYDVSAGERQKVALAAILIGEPRVLLLDEPTKGLDPFARDRWGERLRELRRQGITIVMATHDVEFAARTATHCAMMFDGAVAAVGEPESFFRDNLYYTTARHRLLKLL